MILLHKKSRKHDEVLCTMLSRETAAINNKILLETRFWEETTLVDVNTIENIEIYLGDPRLPGAVLVQTINHDNVIDHIQDITIPTSTGIFHPQVGVYQYIVLPLTKPGLYFDKVWYTPVDGSLPDYEIGSMDVQAVSGAGSVPDSSLGFPRAELFGSITDSAGEPIVGVEIVVNRADIVGLKSSSLISYKARRTQTDNTGKFSIEVLTGVKLVVSIPAIGYRRIFVLNKDVKRQNLATLDSFLYPPVDNPGETNNFLSTSTGEVLRPSSTGRMVDFQHEVNTPVYDWQIVGVVK